VAQIKAQIERADSSYDKDKLKERLGKLAGGVAVIKVGLSSGNISLAEKKRGYLPLMAVGLRYDGGRNWYLQYEESRYTDGSRFRERYLGIGYRF
jgi:hypothetical protein